MYLNKRTLGASLMAILMAGTQLAMCDTVTLKSGETIPGKILSETDNDVTIQVQVSASITDERTIAKSDIAKVDKEQEDDLAYQKLQGLQPDPLYSQPSDTYFDELSSLNAFLTQYPASSHVADVKKQINALQGEKDHADKGEVKYMGRWLSPTEGAKRQLQLSAVQYLKTMQQQAAAGQLVEAMQTFDSLEKSYITTRSYPAAVTLAQQVVAQLKVALAMRAQQVKADQDQLKKTIAFAGPGGKAGVIAAAKAEQDRGNAAVNAALKNNQKWVPLIPRNMLSIDTLQKTAASESIRLAGIPLAQMNASLAKVDAARAAMDRHNFAGAEAMLKSATEMWTQNEDAKYEADRLKTAMGATDSPGDASSAPTP